MHISNINKVFRRFGEKQIKYRYIILVVFVLATVFCCAGLSKFRIAQNEDSWYGDSDKIKINKKKYEQIFGNNDAVMILVKADDVFAPHVLESIDKIGNILMEEIPLADELTSITKLQVPVGDAEGFSVINPFETGIPTDPQVLKQKKDFILSRSSLVNTLVSDDAHETWITLSLRAYPEGDAKDEVMMDIGYKTEDIIRLPEFNTGDFKLYATGLPYLDSREEAFDNPEIAIRIGIGFIVMILCLIIFIRNIVGVIVPVLATGGAICSVLGAMSWMHVAADSTLIMLPILLGMALSVGYSIHYINGFKMNFRQTGKRYESILKTVEESGWPIFFTVITTMASIISFVFARIKPIAWMGFVSAAIVFVVYLYIVILIPIALSFGKDKKIEANTNVKEGATKLDLIFEKFSLHIIKHSKLVNIITIGIFILLVPGFFFIRTNMDIIKMTGEKVPYIKDIIEMLDTKIGSQYSYDIMIEYQDDDAFKLPENMLAIEELEKRISTLQLTKMSAGKPHIISILSVIKEMNRALNGDDSAYFSIPEDEYMLAQLVEYSSIEMSKDFDDYLDADFKVASVHVDLSSFESEKALQDIDSVNAMLAEIFPDANCCIIGDMMEYAEMSTRLVWGELKSFAFSFIVIAIMLIIAFSGIKIGLIGMIPNLAPVVVIGGIMGYCNIAMDMVTMTLIPMILGIAVDDTIHFTNHVKMQIEKNLSYKDAISVTFREIGKSMFMTTSILCAVFLAPLFSPLHYLSEVSLLLIIGLVSALVADYTITPALIYLTKPFGKDKENK